MAAPNLFSQMKNRPKPTWVIPVVVSVLLALYFLSFRWIPAQEDVRTARMTSSDEGSPAELVAKAWVATNEVNHDETLRFWISFENRSNKDIKGLHFIDFQHPGFDQEGNCWAQNAPLCLGGSEQAEKLPGTQQAGKLPIQQAGKLPDILKAGEVATVSGDLKPAAYHGRYNLSAVFGWSNPQGGEKRKGLSLGPVEVTTEWREGLMTLFRRLHTLFKDLALPILATLLTWWAATWYSESQEKQAQINQIWGTLLGQFLKDTQRYYLPVNGKLSELRRKTRKGKPQKPEEIYEQFYSLMSFMRRMKALSEGIGGFSFKNRTGEDLAALTWGTFRNRVIERFGATPLSAALDIVGRLETLAEFNARLEGRDSESEKLLNLEKAFKEWTNADADKDPFADWLPILDILYWTISFEVNRPFAPWYGSPPEFPESELQDALQDTQKVLSQQVVPQSQQVASQIPPVDLKPIREILKMLLVYLEQAGVKPQQEPAVSAQEPASLPETPGLR